MNKIAVIGFNDTNKTIARLIIDRNIYIDEVIFINEKQEDINDLLGDTDASFFETNTKFSVSDYNCLSNVSMLVILDGDMASIVKCSLDNNFSGMYVVATSDVNIDCYKIYKLANIPTYKVIGIGTMSECCYISKLISDRLKISEKNINVYVLGDKRKYITPYYVSNIGVLSLDDCFSLDELKTIDSEFNNNFNYDESRIDALIYLIDVIINNKREILCVSSYDMETGIYISEVAIVDKSGVRDAVKLNLNDDDINSMNNAIDIIRNII